MEDLGAPSQPVEEEERSPKPPGASGATHSMNQLQWSRIKNKLSYVKVSVVESLVVDLRLRERPSC